MPQVINTNLATLNAQRHLSKSRAEQANAVQRLSSGLRINSGKDDAAGLAIAMKMESVARTLQVGVRNVNDGISALQIADGALSVATEMFIRIKELWAQGQNTALSPSDRTSITEELQDVLNGVVDIFNQAEFNGGKLLIWNGTTGSDLNTWNTQLQTGSQTSDTMSIYVFKASLDAFGDPTGYPNLIAPSIVPGVMTGSAIGLDSNSQINIDQSLDAILQARSNIGAQLNTLDMVIENLQVSYENTSAARSRIVDADYAVESASLAKAQVLQDAGMAMVVQANAQPNKVLQLLAG